MEYKRQRNTVIVRVDKGEDILKELLSLSERKYFICIYERIGCGK